MFCLSRWCSCRAVKIKPPCWLCLRIIPTDTWRTQPLPFSFFPPVFADWLWKLRERWVTKHPWSLPYCAASPADIFNSNSEFPHPPRFFLTASFLLCFLFLFFMCEFLLENVQLPSAIELLIVFTHPVLTSHTFSFPVCWVWDVPVQPGFDLSQ